MDKFNLSFDSIFSGDYNFTGGGKMHIIKRNIVTDASVILKIKAIGFNSNGVLTISANCDDGEFLINLRSDDIVRLKEFLARLD